MTLLSAHMIFRNLCVPILAFIITSPAWASWPLIEREAESNLAGPKKITRVAKELKKSLLPYELKKLSLTKDLQDGKWSAKDFLSEVLRTEYARNRVESCFNYSPDEFREEECQRFVSEDIILYLRSEKQIDDTAGLIFLAHAQKNQKQLDWLKSRNLDIPNYLRTLQGLSKSLERKEKKVEATLLAERSQRRKVKPWGQITPRQELFLKFNLFEIKVLSEILERTQKRLLAAKISIIVDYDGDGEADETVAVNPAERYRFGQNMLKLELVKETGPEGFLPYANVEGPHMIMASSELGLVDEGILKSLISMPELQAKKSEKGKLYLNALWSIGKAGLLAIPGGIYIALPIVIIESYFQGKKAQKVKNAPTLF